MSAYEQITQEYTNTILQSSTSTVVNCLFVFEKKTLALVEQLVSHFCEIFIYSVHQPAMA